MTKIYFTCGTGGVGKTTTSAALGIRLAMKGYRTIILTIDPARRLADSLHLPKTSNTVSTVPIHDGFLQAMMLDASNIFETFAKANSSEEDFNSLVNNRYYQFARDKMGGIQEYMAVLQLIDLYNSKRFDAIVIDTPPARNAMVFFEAPSRIERLFSNSGLRWLGNKGGFLTFSLGSSLISKGFKRLLGERTISDIAQFFSLFAKVSLKLEQSAKTCTEILNRDSTQFWLVNIPQFCNADETESFFAYMNERRFKISGIIYNRMPAAPIILNHHQSKIIADNPQFRKTIQLLDDLLEQEYSIAEQNILQQQNNNHIIIKIPLLQSLTNLQELITMSSYLESVD